MKKAITLALSFVLIFLAACGKGASSNTTLYASTEPGFIVPGYEQFNSPASENGLDGTKIAFLGTLKEQGEANGAFYFIVSTVEGDWLVLVGVPDIMAESEVIGIIETDAEVEIYAEYQGYSTEMELPTCTVVAEGYFFREYGKEEKLNPGWSVLLASALDGTASEADAGDTSLPAGTAGGLSLGETFSYNQIAVTLDGPIEWGVVQNQFSELDGEEVFSVAMTMVNNSGVSNTFNVFSYDLYGPDGTKLDSVSAYFDDAHSASDKMRPDAELTRRLYFHYVGDGDYWFEIPYSGFEVRIPVEHD